jgi:hypothetical protein
MKMAVSAPKVVILMADYGHEPTGMLVPHTTAMQRPTGKGGRFQRGRRARATPAWQGLRRAALSKTTSAQYEIRQHAPWIAGTLALLCKSSPQTGHFPNAADAIPPNHRDNHPLHLLQECRVRRLLRDRGGQGARMRQASLRRRHPETAGASLPPRLPCPRSP